MTFSKSGVSVSAGIPGLRVTAGPRGTYVTVGAGGVRYRHRIAPHSGGGAAPVAPATPTAFPPSSGPTTVFSTADAADLVDQSSAEMLNRLNVCVTTPAYAPVVLIAGLVLAYMLGTIWNWLFYLAGAGALAGAYLTHRRDVEQRTFPLFYNLDSASARDWQELVNGLSHLAQSQRIWRVNSQSDVYDWKRNAGASQLITRHAVFLSPQNPPGIRSNLRPFCLNTGSQRLFFFPDRVYVHQNGRYGCVDYGTFAVHCDASRFIESEGVPNDAQIVDYTWRYVNKDGGPDRRFNDNVQLPIALYGDMALQSSQGLSLFLQVSGLHAAQASVPPLQNAFGRIHSHYATSRRLPVTAPPSPVALAHTPPEEGSFTSLGAIGAIAYCCLALLFLPKPAADSRVSSTPAAQTAPGPTAPAPTLAPTPTPAVTTLPSTAATDASTTHPPDQPPSWLTKEERAQWWVEHNRARRRQEAEAERARQAELRNTRAQLEMLDFQRRQQEKVERTRAQQAESQDAQADLPPSTLLPGQTDPTGTPSATYENAPPVVSGSFGEGGLGGGLGGPSSGPVHVRGYYRKDGTYVRPHTRGRGR